MGAHGGPDVVTDGLVVHLDAANDQSYPGTGTVWKDLSGNNRYGNLINGPSFTTDIVDGFNFDGVNDMIIVNNANSLSWLPDGSGGLPELTIDIWVKSSDTQGIFYTKPWNASGQYNIWIAPGYFYLYTGNDDLTTNKAELIYFNRNVSNGTWTNIVCWANSTEMGYYLNYDEYSGSKTHGLDSNIPTVGNQNRPTGLMTLYPYGTGWGGSTGFSIQGILSRCKVYNRALSASEIKQNFNALRSRYGV